ncbi:hypothetical protein, partial [Massilia psychrophila]|uniref:hypothetical protein n=1 Tax=Massilia psychrophila TaxID=1603353 RepID=UPI001C55845D
AAPIQGHSPTNFMRSQHKSVQFEGGDSISGKFRLLPNNATEPPAAARVLFLPGCCVRSAIQNLIAGEMLASAGHSTIGCAISPKPKAVH